MAKNYSNKRKQQKTWQTTMHQKTDIHHMQMNRTETVKTAEIQIRQQSKNCHRNGTNSSENMNNAR